MDAKNTARHVIEALPARVTMDDVIHALYVASKFDRGEREIRAGKGVSDEEARKRLSKWQKR
jgi:predicted transcriptional regulator